MPYPLLADLVLWIHLLWVLFILGGQSAILLGWARDWYWTRHPWFRRLHLAATLLVALQAGLGMPCPLTVLEQALRRLAGTEGYQRGLISDAIERLLFYSAPDWVFALAYSLFALLVALTYFAYPPRRDC